MTSFYFHHLLKDPVSKDCHILRSWGWGLGCADLSRTQWSPYNWVYTVISSIWASLDSCGRSWARRGVHRVLLLLRKGGGCSTLSCDQALGTKEKALKRVRHEGAGLWQHFLPDGTPVGQGEESWAELCWSVQCLDWGTESPRASPIMLYASVSSPVEVMAF